jgi:protoporphyrinogen/coproporphyrinogen III oxidase
MRKRIAVVGAGPAGLAAAWTLNEAGADVVVLERHGRAGGMLRTELIDGAHVDVGVQLVGSPHTTLFDLARRAAGDSALRRSPGRDALWRRGRAHGITYGSIASMIASGALPTTLKLKLAGRYVPFLKSRASRLDVSDLPGSGGAAFDDESIGAWGRREVGDDFIELLAYPLLAAYYGALPEETAAGVYHALAVVGMDVTVYAAAGGFGSLADAIVGSLEQRGVRFERGVEVQAVRAPRAGGEGVIVDGAGYDGVILAVPANRAAALLRAGADAGEGGAPGGALLGWLDAVIERSTFTVALRLDREFPGDYFGLSFPRASEHGARIAAVCIQRQKLPGLVPSGDALVLLPAPTAVAGLLERSDEDIAAALLPDLEAAVPRITRRVTSARVFRFDDAYTIFAPGHVSRLLQFDEAWLPPTVALAGDYLLSPSVEGAMRSGVRAGRRLAGAPPDRR